MGKQSGLSGFGNVAHGELEWLFVGGGIHATHLAIGMLSHGYSLQDLLVVDPHHGLLERWNRITRNVHMPHLRSTVVHHLDVAHDSLWKFARQPENAAQATFLPPYHQPGFELFQAHARWLVQSTGLAARHLRAKVVAIHLDDGRTIAVETDRGAVVHARRVVLAIGQGETLAWPEWARGLARTGASIHHVLDEELELAELPTLAEELIVGGGLSAVQTALARLERGAKVTVLARHPLRVHHFDTDAGWLGPKRLDDFQNEPSMGRRRMQIQNARAPGTIPYEVKRRFDEAVRDGKARWAVGSIEEAAYDGDAFRLSVSDGSTITTGRVLLATGYARGRPANALVDTLSERYDLPVAQCGFPIVDDTLRWGHPGLFVCGALAELELGPTARNISGARAALPRLLDTIVDDAALPITRASQSSDTLEATKVGVESVSHRSDEGYSP